MISLLTLPSLFFPGLINRPNAFCRKSSLWSLCVIKPGVLAIQSMRSPRLMSSTMLLASKFIDIFNLGSALLYVFVTLSWRSFYVVVQPFQRYYLFCLRRQKLLVTVIFLKSPLLTSSEMHLLQIEISCLVSWHMIRYDVWCLVYIFHISQTNF